MLSHKEPPIASAEPAIAFREAQRRVLEASEPLSAERVALGDALGRVVAQPVISSSELVPFARAAMDGYAVCAVDTVLAGSYRCVRLPVINTIYAEKGNSNHRPQTTTGIATGAPIPHGADAVIPFEWVQRTGDVIEIRRPILIGNHVFPPGEDAHRGDVLAEPGQTVTPALVGLLAAAGQTKLAVHRRPRVGFICTGDELVDVDCEPEHGQIRDSNAPMLVAMARECGADVSFCMTVPDVRLQLRETLMRVLGTVDLLITTGGASIGPRDFVGDVLAELETAFLFRSIALRPAKPTGFGHCAGTLVAVLPGNPAAAFVGFVEIARSALLRLAGRADAVFADLPAVLDGTIKTKSGRTYIAFGRLAQTRSGFKVSPISNQCSALIRTAADANCLIVLPPGEALLHTGDRVVVHVLDWTSVRPDRPYDCPSL